eukprot:3711356-Pleurochrysis_carterae.AAC.5
MKVCTSFHWCELSSGNFRRNVMQSLGSSRKASHMARLVWHATCSQLKMTLTALQQEMLLPLAPYCVERDEGLTQEQAGKCTYPVMEMSNKRSPEVMCEQCSPLRCRS